MTSNGSSKISPEILDALNAFGKMLNIALIYGMNHPSVRAPLAETHTALEALLNNTDQIAIGLFNKTLTVNNKMVSDYTIHLRALERRLISLEIPHLIISRGLSVKELGELVGALCSANTQEGQTLKEKLDAAGLNYIKTEEVEYVAQHEGEHLVGEGEGLGDGAGGEGADEEVPEEDTGPNVHVEQVVAFLKGESASGEAPSEDLEKMLSDPEKLGQLIMESAAVRQSVQSLDDGESLADIVIGCLRRTYEDLSQQKKFNSSRKKASLNKAMLLLEKTVVDKIRNAVGDEQPEVDEQILSTLREMEEQRQVEILAARYAEQHKKLSKSELELIEYAREHGEEKARELFSEAVPESEWRRLMAQARGSGGGSGSGSGSGGGPGKAVGEGLDMGALAIVLDKLENIMQFDETPPALVKALVEEAKQELKTVYDDLAVQADEIQEKVESGAAEENSEARADILLDVSKLSLKLAQPLTVINASVEAALQQISNPELQKDLLDLAYESGQTMKTLLDRLTELVGYPSLQEADAGLPD